MQRTDTIVIGAGQAGLAASRHLTGAGRDHVVIERGRLGERWRSERWDSLRLLTPNWMSRLPGWRYQGPQPDAFMAVSELVAYLEAYATSFDAPVHDQTTVSGVHALGDGYRVETDQGTWRATNVIIATGVEGHPIVPAMAADLAPSINQLTATRYRNPDQIDAGGVLVVGASASGIQLADELARTGREVVLAAGAHTRMPRHYRGHDIFTWLERIGSFDTTVDELPDPAAGARAPSLQLVGRPSHEHLDLAILRSRGVQIGGRVVSMDGASVSFGQDLARDAHQSDQRMHRVLDQIDAYLERCGAGGPSPDRPAPITLDPGPAEIDLRDRRITTVLWATGFGRSYPWLHVPGALGTDGELIQRRGVTPARGLYVLGLRFQHHRNSNFIDGVGRDAAYVVDHLCARRAAREEVAA